MKTYACHLCEAEWNAGELPIRPDGSYDCPGCGYTFWASKRTTRWVQDTDWQSSWWNCKHCNEAWFWNDHPKNCNINYCPKCGYKIVEFVDFKDPWEDEDGAI